MNIRNHIVTFGLYLIMLPVPAAAINTTLSGVFDGSESEIPALPGTCPGASELAYQVISPLTVSATGAYFISDAFEETGGKGDITALVYEDEFNPGAPLANLLTPNGISIDEELTLTSGQNYSVVVQHWCLNLEAAWALTFSGPGTVNSDYGVLIPEQTQGEFVGEEPSMIAACDVFELDGPVVQKGALEVSRSGTYYFQDILENRYYFYGDADSVDICLYIYSAPFDIDNPVNNRIAALDYSGTVELIEGRNYYLVVQAFESNALGDFFFVLAPPAPFRITHAMAGGWYNPATNGQGLVLDVFDKLNQMFAAWFTYDLERPDPGVTAMIGDPGHRWVTAQGPFEGDTADLLLYWTEGGVFDSADPAPGAAVQDGTLEIEFSDCLNGTVTYDLGSGNTSGQFPIQRLANDAEDLCESLFTGPGQPGPL
jgi:hypothetical protein